MKPPKKLYWCKHIWPSDVEAMFVPPEECPEYYKGKCLMTKKGKCTAIIFVPEKPKQNEL